MKFSVLMSVYHKEQPGFLEDALKSLIEQTTMPDEIVLVKDGPLGMELEYIINKYVREYNKLFKIIDLEKNMGLGNALKIGVRECSYNLIARMDSDDIARKDRFTRQLKAFEDNNHLDICGSNILEFEDDIKNIISSRIVPQTDTDIKMYARKRCPFNHMTVMYKKEAVLKVGNYESIGTNEDYHLWMKMIIANCNMININENLVFARVNSMYERRGGLAYVNTEMRLQKIFLKNGFTNHSQYFFNICSRSIVRVMPSGIRKKIYVNLLRNT